MSICIFTIDFNRSALNASYVTIRLFQDFGFVTLAFAILEILAIEHAGPIAGFSTAGTCLNINKAIARIHLVVEHPTELKIVDDLAITLNVLLNRSNRLKITFFFGHIE